MRIGILGGSFDPIHRGHLNMAERALKEYRLDQVWLIPAGHSPNKDEEKMTPGEFRLQMTAAAIGAELLCEANPASSDKDPAPCRMARGTLFPGLWVSALEVDDPQTSYTFRTMEKLHLLFPGNRFFFIMGADSLDYFDHWVRPERICALATVLVVNRDQFTQEQLQEKILRINRIFPADIRIVHCSKLDISSSAIREALGRGEEPGEYLTPEVISYIRAHGLYLKEK